METFENVLRDEAAEDTPFDDACESEPLRTGEEMAKEYEIGTLVKGTVGWLKRVHLAEKDRIEREKLHHKFDVNSGREKNLGPYD